MTTHPLHHLGFEALLSGPSCHPITNGPRDAATGRAIVQPTKDAAVNQALATAAMPIYKERLLAAIHKIPGAELAATRARKNPRRLEAKINQEGQPAETVSDYGAAQIMVDSPQTKAAVVAAIRRGFPVLRVQDYFQNGDPTYRYRHYSMQLQMPNGASEELQIVPREVMEANRDEHHIYKRARNAELAARELNDSAMERFDSRNGVSVVKGARVRLANGTPAKVVYADPNMRIARVRTDEGKSLTVRHKDLRGFS
jgi:hypothetical protein